MPLRRSTPILLLIIQLLLNPTSAPFGISVLPTLDPPLLPAPTATSIPNLRDIYIYHVPLTHRMPKFLRYSSFMWISWTRQKGLYGVGGKVRIFSCTISTYNITESITIMSMLCAHN